MAHQFKGNVSVSGTITAGEVKMTGTFYAAPMTMYDRLALVPSADGALVYDSTLEALYMYVGGVWKPVVGDDIDCGIIT